MKPLSSSVVDRTQLLYPLKLYRVSNTIREIEKVSIFSFFTLVFGMLDLKILTGFTFFIETNLNIIDFLILA